MRQPDSASARPKTRNSSIWALRSIGVSRLWLTRARNLSRTSLGTLDFEEQDCVMGRVGETQLDAIDAGERAATGAATVTASRCSPAIGRGCYLSCLARPILSVSSKNVPITVQ